MRGITTLCFKKLSFAGDFQLVQILFQHEADMSPRSALYHSALHAAVDRDRYDVVQLFLQNQAEVDIRDEDTFHQTPFMWLRRKVIIK